MTQYIFRNEAKTIRNVKDVLNRPEFLKEILSTIKLNDHEIIRIDKTYTIDSDMKAVTAVLRNNDKDRLEKIAVLFKAGIPSLRQMKELVYTIGSDCEYKIALNNESKNPADHEYCSDSGCSACAESFIEALISQNVPTYLVNVDEDGIYDDDEAVLDLALYQCYESSKVDPKMPRLSLKDVEEIEFWVADYPDPFEETCVSAKRSDDWSHCSKMSHYAEDGRTLSSLEWNEEGMTAVWRAALKEEKKALEWIFRNKKDEVRRFFNTLDIQREGGEYEELKVFIKIWNKPYRDYVLSDPSEKARLIDEFMDLEQRSLNLLNGFMAEYEKMTNARLQIDGEEIGRLDSDVQPMVAEEMLTSV